MDEVKTELDLSQWFSTYGIITAERILGRYQIQLPHNELLVALKSPFSFYHRVLQVPLKNVLNGIVLQQANDYHIYVQKLFVDYLLSGESSKEPGAQGASTRESLEDERTLLVTLGEDFHRTKLEHDSLIASSQTTLIKITGQWNQSLDAAVKSVNTLLMKAGHNHKKSTIKQAINHAMIHCDLSIGDNSMVMDKMNEVFKDSFSEEIKISVLDSISDLISIAADFNLLIEPFVEKSNEMNVLANSFRNQFYETILRVLVLIKLLPDYRMDEAQDLINREPLHFDNRIGEL